MGILHVSFMKDLFQFKIKVQEKLCSLKISNWKWKLVVNLKWSNIIQLNVKVFH